MEAIALIETINKYPFKISVLPGENYGEYIVYIEGETCGVKVSAEYDDDATQFIHLAHTGGRRYSSYKWFKCISGSPFPDEDEENFPGTPDLMAAYKDEDNAKVPA